MTDWLRSVDWAGMLWVFSLAAVAGMALLALLEGLRVLRPAAGPGNLAARGWGLARRREGWLVLGLAVFALAIRLFMLGRYPMGFNPDEASIAYDAWCMAEYGTDRYGYTMPAYLIAWGSGQNALYMYLLVPLYRLFGYSQTITRLPQAVLGAAAVPLLWLALRRAGGRAVALCGAALLAACPWHIMASRWALEVYPLIPLLLGGVVCLLYAAEKPALWLPAFACFALALYSYITAAVFLLVFLPLALAWVLLRQGIRWRWFLPGAALGLALALPLLLFVLVNAGVLAEIRTPFLSVPLMPEYRGDEVGADIAGNARLLWDYFIWQRPQWRNSLFDHVDAFGIVYLFSTPFALGGLGVLAWRMVRAARGKGGTAAAAPAAEGDKTANAKARPPRPALARRLAPELLWLAFLAAALATALLVWPQTLNRSMTLALAYVALTAFGLAAALRRLALLRPAALVGYAGGFALFFLSYFFGLAPAMGQKFCESLPQALATADAVAGGRDIIVPQTVSLDHGSGSVWPYICLNRRLSPDEFQAQYRTGLKPEVYGEHHSSLGNVYFALPALEAPAQYGTDRVYVLYNHLDPVAEYEAMGFETEVFRNYTVAWMAE